MQSGELNRWREANRLFAEWLALEEAARHDWLASLRADEDVATLLRQLVARHAADDGATLGFAGTIAAVPSAVPVRDALSGRRIGDWTLLDELGRGGMSVVYRARRDGGFDQFAAIKLLGLAALGSDGTSRFEHERAVLARLRHPHIATLIDGGIADDGTPYLAMALVEGLDLATYCDTFKLDWRHRVRLVRMVCDAVAYAHRNLLVHRDIKPSNILVTREGLPILLDFGIAKLLDVDTDHTRTGMRALTPAYAAPEQLNADVVTTATDVYALGIVLRNLCDRIPSIPVDLRNIIAKATRGEPDRRYPDARALGEDLDNLLQQRPVEATPDSWAYRLSVLLRRRRGAVVAGVLVVASLVAGLSVALWQAHRAAQEAMEARRQAARAEASRDFLFSIVHAGDRTHGNDADVPVSQVIQRGVLALQDQPPEDPELHAEMAMMLGELETIVGQYDSAMRLFDASGKQLSVLDNPALVAGLSVRRGVLANTRGDPAAAISHFEDALAAARGVPDERKAALVPAALDGWAYAMDNTGRGDEARHHLEEVLATASYAPPDSDAHVALLVALQSVTRNPPDRLALLRRIDDAYRKLRPSLTDRIVLAHGMASAHLALRQPAEALPWAREASHLTDRAHPGATIRRARARNNLGNAASHAFSLGEAVAAHRFSLDLYRQLGDERSPAYAAALHNLGVLLRDIGHPQAALPLLEQATALAREHFGDADIRRIHAQRNLALARAFSGDAFIAATEWQDALRLLPDSASALDRHDMWVSGALIAASRKDAAETERLAGEITRLVAAEASPLLANPRARAWQRGLPAIATALRGDAAAAQQLFQEALADVDHAHHADWAAHRHILLVWAEHCDREGDGDAARRHRADAAALLRAGGLEADDLSGTAVLPD